jgi:hypothetical protein
MMRFLVLHICCLSVDKSYNCTKLVGTCFQVVVVVVVVDAFKGHAFWHDCYGWVFVCLSMKWVCQSEVLSACQVHSSISTPALI